MQDLALVYEEQPEAQLDKPVPDLRLREPLASAPLLQGAEVSRLTVLGDDAQIVAIVKSLDVAQDARVLEVREDCGVRVSRGRVWRRQALHPLTCALALRDAALIRLHALDVNLLNDDK